MGRHKQDDRTRCYCRRCNRLTSQRCHLHDVSSHLFTVSFFLSLSIRNGLRVTKEEAMRAVREQDSEQPALKSREQEKVRQSIGIKKVNVLVKHFIDRAKVI